MCCGSNPRIQARSSKLHTLLKDDSDAFGREVATCTKGDFDDFYSNFNKVRDYHKKHPHQLVEPLDLEFMKLDGKIKDGVLLVSDNRL